MRKHANAGLAVFGATLLILTGCAGTAASRQRAGEEQATVIVECVLQSGGRMSDCLVVSEQPPGLGFGEAALAGARQSRINLSDTPRARAGEKVRFSFRFRLEEPPRP